MNTKFLFLDICTQKLFIENFGSKAVADCPDIRENLMELTHIALREQIPIVSLMLDGEGEDYEKVADTETETFTTELSDEFMQLRVFDEIPESVLDKFKDRVVFIYGVPLNTYVYEVCIQALTNFAKVWLVEDAVKASDGTEESIINDLKEKGVKTITTRNLDKFITV